MLEFTVSGIKIEVDEVPGIYTFNDESGLGKTRFYRLLREYHLIDDSIVAYSYNDEQHGIKLENLLNKPKLVMIDRFDLLKNKNEDLINSLRFSAVVLIDYKQYLPFDYCIDCGFKMDKDKIKVTIYE